MSYIPIPEFAEFIGRDKSVIYKLIKKGLLLSFKKEGSQTFIHKDKGLIEYKANVQEQPQKIPLKVESITPEITKKSGAPAFAHSRQISEAYRAKLLQLDYEQKRGKLVDASEVEEAVYAAWRMVRNRVLSCPGRLAPLLEGKTGQEIEQAILKDLSDCFEEIRDWSPIPDLVSGKA